MTHPFFTLSSLIIIFLLFLQYISNINAIEDIITDTCKKATNPNLKYDFCVTTLQADPNSHNTDLQGLGIISIKLSIQNVSYIQSQIQKLLNDHQSGGDLAEDVKSCLQNCLKLYNDVIPDLNDALNKFNSMDYAGANVKLDAANEASIDCQYGFLIKGLVSPLTKDNDNCFQLTAIGQAIAHMFA